MDVLTNIHVVTISQCVYICQIIAVYTVNLHNVISQLYLSKDLKIRENKPTNTNMLSSLKHTELKSDPPYST